MLSLMNMISRQSYNFQVDSLKGRKEIGSNPCVVAADVAVTLATLDPAALVSIYNPYSSNLND